MEQHFFTVTIFFFLLQNAESKLGDLTAEDLIAGLGSLFGDSDKQCHFKCKNGSLLMFYHGSL